MKPTDKQIQEAALKIYEDSPYPFNQQCEDFAKGAKWVIEQMQPEWVSVEDRLPEIDKSVIVKTAFFRDRKYETETFIGFMDEYGELYSLPEGESYGWQFNDCVTHWMPLPEPPKQ